MKNPWLNLRPSDSSYVVEMDRECIDRYNRLVGDSKQRVIKESIPEPFIGNPALATVVLLGLNPGHSETIQNWHDREDFRNAMLHNLDQKPQPYPFYPLNPAFEGNGAGEWWRPRTRELQRESGLDPATFAERLLVIEWFPYHTATGPLRTKRVCGSTGCICESQYYSFQLAKQMLQKMLDGEGVLVVGMRSRKQWMDVDRRFGEIPFLKNPQSGYVSRGNTEPGLFERIVAAIRWKR